MYIEEILNQNRRDFTATYKCEHCGHESKGYGYDDAYFHTCVVPNMRCAKCEKTACDYYVPKETKYPEWYQV